MSEPLEVWLNGRRVGTLTPTRSGATFLYDASVAEQLEGVPLLSASLPVQRRAFDAEKTRSWFVGLLPEDRQREELVRRFNLQRGSYIDLLREVGWECAGAVVVAPVGHIDRSARLMPLSESDIASRLSALPSHPFDDNDALRVSLGGYQSKLLLTRTAHGWALPVAGAVSTHILKPQPVGVWPGIVEGEAWAMTTASAATATAEIELWRHPGAPTTLVVTRFDRRGYGSSAVRLHQEDAAQALGVHPDRKYAGRTVSKADPSFARIASLLDRFSLRPIGERQRLLEQIVVTVALGNTDAHAKNFGLIHDTDQTLTLSPLYDVVPAAVVNPSMLDLGMRVGGTLRIDRVTTGTIIEEARSWGLGEAAARSVVEKTLLRLRLGAEVACERMPEIDPRVSVYASDAIAKLLDGLVSAG